MKFKKSLPDIYQDCEYRRTLAVKRDADSEDVESAVKIIVPGAGKNSVTLVPMRSLSVERFSFPFSNSAKIRDALKLQVMPFASAGEVEIFPVITERQGKASSGMVWYVSSEEFPGENVLPNSGKIWPSPLPFVRELEEYDGNGVTVWVDEENVCSIFWQSYEPLMYRWKGLKGHSGDETVKKELEFYDNYSKACELERGGSYIVDGKNPPEDFAGIAAESVRLCPWIDSVNISRSAAAGARDLERLVKVLTGAAVMALISGVIMLGAQVLKSQVIERQLQEIRTRSEEYYRKTFEPDRRGRIANPVNLARDRISSLRGTGDENSHSLDEVLVELGVIFSSENFKETTIDIIRYNADGFDCTGTAPDMTTVLNLRKSWEEALPDLSRIQVDNTQYVAGIGYRFDLRVRW